MPPRLVSVYACAREFNTPALRSRLDRKPHELLAALGAGLEQSQAQMQEGVLAAYDRVTRKQAERAEAVIARDFRPAQAGK